MISAATRPSRARVADRAYHQVMLEFPEHYLNLHQEHVKALQAFGLLVALVVPNGFVCGKVAGLNGPLWG